MAIAAIVPIANLAAANAQLEAEGWGPNNFSVPLYSASVGPEFAGAHFGGNIEAPLVASIKGLPGVFTSEILSEVPGTGKDRFRDCLTQAGAEWANDFPVFPDIGIATVGNYQHTANGETTYWRVIQQIDRGAFPGAPDTLAPAIIRQIRLPGSVLPWVQPLDQFDAYRLENPFTGLPDQVTHNGQTWTVTQADGAGNNVWEPGVFGWTVV